MGNEVNGLSVCDVNELNRQEPHFLILHEKQIIKFLISSRQIIEENQISQLLHSRPTFEKLDSNFRIPIEIAYV